MVERFNRTMVTMLSLYVSENQKDWDEKLPCLMMAYRASQHSSTRFTPNRMMLGREVELPLDVQYGTPAPEVAGTDISAPADYVQRLSENMAVAHESARGYLQHSSEYQKRYYDIGTSKPKFAVGDQVWLFTPRRKKGLSPKLQKYWQGPFKVITKLSEVVYRVKRDQHAPMVVHANRLKPYVGA
jgi:hypothetical protein